MENKKFKEEVYSHCQVRGSCPFFWSQVDQEGHKEKVHIENKDDLTRHIEYFSDHFHEMFKDYWPSEHSGQVAREEEQKQSLLINPTIVDRPTEKKETKRILCLNLLRKKPKSSDLELSLMY
jgi:hypothetical protein